MPRAKRTLAESDPNAAAAAASAKKASRTGASVGKENVTSQGAKQVTVEPGSSATKTSKKARPRKEKPAADTALDYITVCRPFSDIDLEKRANDEEDEEDEESDEEEDTTIALEDRNNPLKCLRKGCLCDKPATENPTWKWIVSRQARKMHINLGKEAWKRDQDAQGEYQYNDFTGYGFQEVVENMLSDFNKEYMKVRARSPIILWQHVEAMAHFLGTGDLVPWMMMDDGDRIAHTISLIGTMLLSTIDVLNEKSLFSTNSIIKDIPLVLALAISFTMEYPAGPSDELQWRKVVVRMAKEHDIKITGPFGMDEKIEEIEAEVAEDLEAEAEDEDEDEEESEPDSIDEDITLGVRSWRKWNFKDELQHFRKLYGTSKDHYDLTKKSKQSSRGQWITAMSDEEDFW